MHSEKSHEPTFLKKNTTCVLNLLVGINALFLFELFEWKSDLSLFFPTARSFQRDAKEFSENHFFKEIRLSDW